MATPSIGTARGWRGRVMVDRDSNKIGEVVDIYLDNETDRPEWAVVQTGLFGLRSTFVPLAEAREVGDELQVPHQRLQVKQAPNIEPDGQLSAAEEAELFPHYGLDYDSVTLDNGAPAGQALAEPVGQTDTPDRDEQAGRPRPTSPSRPAARPGAGRHRDRRRAQDPSIWVGVVPSWTERRLTPPSRVRAGPGRCPRRPVGHRRRRAG
ncbi:MAG TPA: PRC-barrel domain-containing protein [Actinomycetota bacterium]|nr:PRC-barrel domain-containing protein [Actinomycetota bacterium]